MTKPSATATGATPATDKPRRNNAGKPQLKGGADWDAIERDFRTTRLSLSELGAKHGVDKSRISRRSRNNDWKRDLTEAVRLATKASVIEAAIQDRMAERGLDGGVPKAQQRALLNVVEATAELNKQVIMGHRSDLRRLRETAERLLSEVEKGLMNRDEVQRLAKILAGEEATVLDIGSAREVLKKAIGIGGRVNQVKAIAETVRLVHAGERQAFSLDAEDPPPPPPSSESVTEADASKAYLEWVRG